MLKYSVKKIWLENSLREDAEQNIYEKNVKKFWGDNLMDF